MRMRIFQIAILCHPTADEEKAGKRSELVLAPENILAQDQASAGILAARKIPEEMLDKLDRLEVAVKPF